MFGCRGLAAKYHMPMELAYSMASLALYDIIIYADDSGSMAFEENGERINDLKLMVGRVADVATMFDDDGILVRFMNGTTEGNGIRDSASAGQLISQASCLHCPSLIVTRVPTCSLNLLAGWLVSELNQLLSRAAVFLRLRFWYPVDQSGKLFWSPS